MQKIFYCFFFSIAFLVADNIEMLKNKIKKEYEVFYKNHKIEIHAITLGLSQSSQINEVQIKKVVLDSKDFLAQGKIKIIFLYKNKEYAHFVEYYIDATLKAIFAKNEIKKSQDISTENIRLKPIELSRILSPIINPKDVNHVGAKIFIPKETLITQNLIESKILIRKNDTFLAVYKEGNMQIQLTLIAKEDGAKNAIIEALNPETKKVLRVRILTNNMGEVL
ncbi:flagellar basal body P-ring formation chaperone FlgA [Helicobacter anatolicus]|uniref:flagellar basal body P-ring formation chaperone FlgA n=1 Tax=Helicobacter anatolicus TaxID=2905874 RepID=UPI001E3FB3CF|nr:flagellar basal body P-ring formation chaperone FlgA [Helicobacter anatolicus]